MNLLQDIHVLVTRPAASGEALCVAIRELGGEALHFPTIEFIPAADQAGMRTAMNAAGEQDWLIFISPQSVYASIVGLRQTWPQFPPALRLAAVGAGTANALKEAGLIVDACPHFEWSSEGLLAMPPFQALNGKRVMIVRGDGGRELLQTKLTARGAIVSHLIAYQRRMPAVDATAYQTLFQQHKIDVVICASFEAVKNFKMLMGDAAWDDVKDVPLVVMSDRIKVLAHELGFQTIWVTSRASQDAIITVLTNKRNQLCQMKRLKQH